MAEANARDIANELLKSTQVWIALIGFVGGIIGGILASVGNLLPNWVQHRKERKLDRARAGLLKHLLETADWRELSVLRHVIGADRDTTTRLLIEMQARGRKKPREDGEEEWGLISKHPLDASDEVSGNQEQTAPDPRAAPTRV
jgi:hypothetical protein